MEKNVVLLHSNDLHNSLFFELGDDFLLHGGISMLSEYINTVRRSEKNVLYTISGDILQEDISGSDYKGTNTVDIINAIAPDAISLGNHELDYGLAHLLIFKECIKIPTLNANILVSQFQQNLFTPSKILNAGDVRILTIGVIPKAFFNRILSDPFCNSMLEYRDSYEAIREEIKKYTPEDYDMVALLSHYGLHGDEVLAENMPEDLPVNIILGGHDHIDMDQAEVVNNILIAQSSFGTTHVGRFDLTLNTDLKKIEYFTWKRVEINSELCGFDTNLDRLTDRSVMGRKPLEKRIVCTFAGNYTQENRVLESQLGDIVADAFYHTHHPDLVIISSGSLRKSKCPRVMMETDLKELYPFDDSFCIANITGKQLKQMMEYLFSVKPDGNIMTGTFQYSEGFRLVVNADGYLERGALLIEEMTLNGKPLEDNKLYRIGATKNFISSSLKHFNIIIEPDQYRIVSFSTYYDLAKYLLSFEGPISAPELGHRFTLRNWEF